MLTLFWCDAQLRMEIEEDVEEANAKWYCELFGHLLQNTPLSNATLFRVGFDCTVLQIKIID